MGTEEPVALFSHQRRLSQDAFSERAVVVRFRFSHPMEEEITS